MPSESLQAHIHATASRMIGNAVTAVNSTPYSAAEPDPSTAPHNVADPLRSLPPDALASLYYSLDKTALIACGMPASPSLALALCFFL